MENCIWIGPSKKQEFGNAIFVFRKTVTLKKVPTKVEISAESRYKMFVNGILVGFGPCKGTREVKYFDEFEIFDAIKDGQNEIVVEVLRLCPNNEMGNEIPMDSIFRLGTCALCLQMENGENVIRADETFEVAKKEITFSMARDAYSACINENVAEKKPLTFANAVKIDDVHNNENEHFWWGCTNALFLSKRPIPMLEASPKEIAFDGEFYDAGVLTFGYPTFEFSGNGTVKIAYFECFGVKDEQTVDKDRTDRRGSLRENVVDTIEVNGKRTYSPFYFRCFRFIKITTTNTAKATLSSMLEVNYPLTKKPYDFGTERDNQLYQISVRTLRRCTHETYEDCPYYEQLQYTMDSSLQMLFQYQLTDDDRLARKCMDDFAQGQHASGLMPSRYPCIYDQHIPSFQLYFIFMVYEHFRRFGDLELVKRHIGAVDGVLYWYSQNIDKDGIVMQSKYWNFIDWALPWGYNEKRKMEGGAPLGVYEGSIGIYNPMLAYFFTLASKLHEILGQNEKTTEYQKTAEKLKKATKVYYDKEKGIYADDRNHQYFSQHMQTWCVLAGVVSAQKGKTLLKKTENIDTKVTFAFVYFYFRALEQCGLYDKANAYMDTYRRLIDLHCTTIPETPQFTRSECHAWGAIAIYEFNARVLGVQTLCPNQKSVVIQPYLKGRKYAKGVVCSIAGDVFVSWKKQNGVFEITVRNDSDYQKKIVLPNGKEVITRKREISLKCKL